MNKIIIVNRENEEEVYYERMFEEGTEASKYFNLLKIDYANRKDEFYDKDKEVKYSDIKVVLDLDGETSYFTIG